MCSLVLSCSIDSDDSSGSFSNYSSVNTNTGSEIVLNADAELVRDFDSSESLNVLTLWKNSYKPNSSSRDITDDSSDIYYESNFSGKIYINLTDLKVSADSANYSEISSSEIKFFNDTVKIKFSENLLTINSSGSDENLKFILSGSLEGGIFFKNAKEKDIAVVLNSATIRSGNYPCIEFDKKSRTFLISEGTNNLIDGRIYGTGYSESEGVDYYTSSFTGTKASGAELTEKFAVGSSKKGSVYAKGQLLLSGSGSTTLAEDYKHGFYSKDYIRVFSGTYDVKSTGRNAFQAVNGFIMDDGSIKISGTGTNTNNESRGIIVEGLDYEDGSANKYAGEGFIVIKGGKIDSTTVSKGISAKWDIDEDAGSSATSDDPYPYVLISGGNIIIKTTGTPKDESNSAYTFRDANGVSVSEKTKLSPEGIEGKQAVFITGGIIQMNCTDDAINASREDTSCGGLVKITGGNIFAYSSGNDAIDSNGELMISGGIVVATGLSIPECAFDCDRNTFAVTGGLLVGVGTGNYSEPSAYECSQSVIVLSGDYFGNSAFAIEDSKGNPVFAYETPSNCNSNHVMILSSPLIKTGVTYKSMKSCSFNGGKNFHGLYTSLPSVSGGSNTNSSIKTTESSYVYTKASVSNMGAQEGTHPNSGFPR